MGVFTDIEMVWEGRTYTIKSTRVMGAIAQMEEHVTLAEIAAYGRRGRRRWRGCARAMRRS